MFTGDDRMKILIIYDSVFGNTEKIAQSMGSALGSQKEVQVIRVTDATVEQLSGVKLLLVGSPTRGFRATEGISTYLKNLPKDILNGVRAAAFDTRIPLETIKSGVFRFIVSKGGYAAPIIAKKLAEKEAEIVAQPEGFFVKESEGPLVDGELERAAVWAKGLKG